MIRARILTLVAATSKSLPDRSLRTWRQNEVLRLGVIARLDRAIQ
jgi:hypothetical protein